MPNDKLTIEDLNEILNKFVLGPTGECSLKMNPYISFNITRQLYDTMRENERYRIALMDVQRSCKIRPCTVDEALSNKESDNA
jgi:hypothetical protein